MTNTTLRVLTEDRNQETGNITSGRKYGQMIKDAIAEMVERKYEMTEEEKREMDQRIEQKLKAGKKLSSEEMEYLKMYNPDLYRRVLRIEMKRKMLRTQLRNAKSKEEVHTVTGGAMVGIDKDPDKEYMAAMIHREAGEFMRSAAYARLPKTVKEGRKKKSSDSARYYAQKESKEKEQETTHQFSVFTQLKIQCNQIGKLIADSRV